MKKTIDLPRAEAELRNLLEAETLQRIVFSRPADESERRCTGRLFRRDGAVFLQLERQLTSGKVFHRNVALGEALPPLLEELNAHGQVNVLSDAWERELKAIGGGRFAFTRRARAAAAPVVTPAHDHAKERVFPEGVPEPFLCELGIMDAQGTVYPKAYDKFRQINRFMEFLVQALSHLPQEGPLVLADLCCGKAVLSFAAYAYLHRQGRPVELYCVDLKPEVIARGRRVAAALGFEGMRFLEMDIRQFELERPADMVISLHACDVATDLVLAKAVGWQAKAILSCPCCHHELAAQLDPQALRPVLQYPILKQRFAELLTDAIRANALALRGYRVEIMEFIELEHTHKNLLLQAVRRGKAGGDPAQLEALCAAFSVQPSILRLLDL